MRVLHALLQAIAARLDPRGRRVLVFTSALALAFFARATLAAAHSRHLGEAAASLLLLALATVAAAVAWSVPRRVD